MGEPTVTPHASLDELRDRLRGLTEAPVLDPATRPRRSGNGYGGVELRDPFLAPAAADAMNRSAAYRPKETWRVFAGVITRRSDEGIRCWADPDCHFEEWLVTLLEESGARVPSADGRARSRQAARR